MNVRVETISAEQVLGPEDHKAAEIAGLAPDNLEALYETTAYHFPETTLEGTNRAVHSLRVHTGPEGPWRGGTKFKPYDGYENPAEALVDDGVRHAAPMNRKFPAYGVHASGGKTIADVPYEATPDQKVNVLQHIARSCVEAGIANPDTMVTAGDEGTNGLLAEYRQAFHEAGAENADLLVMGTGFPARGPATGRGSIMYMREQMRIENIDEARFVSVGAGAAGGHALADAYDPAYEADSDRRIIIPALGDLRRNFGNFPRHQAGAVLYTEDTGGLRFTQQMLEELQNKEDADRLAVDGWLIGAIARKLERDGQNVRVVEGADALTFDDGRGDPNSFFMAPAATSNMIHAGNVHDIAAGRILEIGNSTIVPSVMPVLRQRGIRYMSGHVVNAPGAYMSTIQSDFEMKRQITERVGGSLQPEDPAVYDDQLRQKVNKVANQVHRLTKAFGIEDDMAANVLTIVNAAIRHGMPINHEAYQAVQDTSLPLVAVKR